MLHGMRLATLMLTLLVLSAANAQQASIHLYDGTACLHAGFGATLAFDGDRLSYTCDGDGGLLGDPDWTGDQLTVDRVWLDAQASPVALVDRSTSTLSVGRVVLLDGSVCLSTGHGATLALDAERLAYVCGTGATGLVGDAEAADGVFTAHLVDIVTTPDGTSLRDAGQAVVVEIDARSPIAVGEWLLASFTSGSDDVAIVPGAAPTLNVQAGMVNGTTGCNSYFGPVTLGTSGAFSVGILGSTFMACPEPLMSQEHAFLQALERVRFTIVAGDELRMYGPTETLVFQHAASDMR